MVSLSARLALPYLEMAQAQKELTHNEALALVDIAVQPVVQAVAPAAVPLAPALGQCWIVGPAPSGAWAGNAGALAGWTSGGWRFVAAREGMTAWSIADGVIVRRDASNWIVGQATANGYYVGSQRVVAGRQSRVIPPSGGTTIDIQARTALAAIIAGLEAHGLFSTT